MKTTAFEGTKEDASVIYGNGRMQQFKFRISLGDKWSAGQLIELRMWVGAISASV